jgi:hypothetical protein
VERISLDRLSALVEEVLFVSDDETSERVPGSSVPAVIRRGVELEGDAICVCTVTSRVIVVQHEGVIFDVERRLGDWNPGV